MDIKKLQRVVVDALEDVKAQNIKVFNTMGLSDMFDRVVLASGTSNRQTRALAYRVAQQVKEAGGHVVSVEGADTGEWVLVDLGDLVVHVMQPAIREYYSLEEIWGGKPVRVKTTDTGARRIAAHASADDAPAAHESAARTHGEAPANASMNGAGTDTLAGTFFKASSEAPAGAPAPSAPRGPSRKAAGKTAPAKTAAKTVSAKSAGEGASATSANRVVRKTAAKSPAGRTVGTAAPVKTPRKTASGKRVGTVSSRPAVKTASGKTEAKKPSSRSARKATPGKNAGKAGQRAAPRKSTATRRPTRTTAATRSPARKAGVAAAKKARRS
jgi:ribosome-associated protein